MITIKRIEFGKVLVNGKIITLDGGKAVNGYDLSRGEENAVRNFLKAETKGLKDHKVVSGIFRIIALPFFSISILLVIIKLWIIYSLNFLKYGGESVTYSHKEFHKTILDVFNKVK